MFQEKWACLGCRRWRQANCWTKARQCRTSCCGNSKIWPLPYPGEFLLLNCRALINNNRQIRLLDGKTLTHTFGAKEPLSAVRLFIELNRTDGSQPFDLAQNFPKRVFDDEQMEASLEVLGEVWKLIFKIIITLSVVDSVVSIVKIG